RSPHPPHPTLFPYTTLFRSFPKSHFFGFDYHDKSVEAARESAKRNGIADHVTFEVAKAKEFPGRNYDFVAVFDCLHDMGDPIGADRKSTRLNSSHGSISYAV